MDIDTTSINELPIVNDTPVSSEEMMSKQQHAGTDSIMIDANTIVDNPSEQSEKKVRIDENRNRVVAINKDQPPSAVNAVVNSAYAHGDFKLTDEVKIIIMACFLFFIFMDSKIKKYLLNILVQIFGTFLKTENNTMTQIGLLFYSLLYGIFLYGISKMIDINSFSI